MGDARGTIEFELWKLVESMMPTYEEVLESLSDDERRQLTRDAAGAIAGPLIWRDLLGEDRLDTTKAALLLGVTRQAINKRVKGHTLLGVPGRGTTWFPLWQFDVSRNRVKPTAETVLQSWSDMAANGALAWDAFRILSWATTEQPELDGATPEEWIIENRDPEAVVAAARRAARAASA